MRANPYRYGGGPSRCRNGRPNPQVAGQGIRMYGMQNYRGYSGISQCQRMHSGLCEAHYPTTSLVRIKTAASLDGSVALANGASHGLLAVPRARMCSTGVLVATPSPALVQSLLMTRLTVRDPNYAHAAVPLRVVLDSVAAPNWCADFTGAGGDALVHQRGSGSPELAAGDNVQQLHLPDGPQDLDGLLVELGQRGCNEVLIEAGPAVVGSFLQSGLWDEWIAYVAPKVLGSDSQSMADLVVSIYLMRTSSWCKACRSVCV